MQFRFTVRCRTRSGKGAADVCGMSADSSSFRVGWLSRFFGRKRKRVRAAADTSGMWRAEVRGKHQAVMFRTMAEYAQTRLHGLFGIHADPTIPGRLIDLDRVVHHVADKEALVVVAEQSEHNLARRMSRRRLDQKAVAKLVGHPHDMILLRGDHGQHGIGKDVARLLGQMRIF
jgi:hypothetical protein